MYGPSIAGNSDNNIIIVWRDDRDGNYDIYAWLYPIDNDCDGAFDWQENATGCRDRLSPDTDGDGLCDGNTSVFDGGTFQICVPGEDMDRDGQWDVSETNPCEVDTDHDGISDPEEINTTGTDPARADSDNDGVNDYFELFLGTDPADPDSDNDGRTDGEEVLFDRTDPNDPTNTPPGGPTLINYQGRLTDDMGVAVSDTVTIDFSIFDGATSGLLLWTETQPVQVENGIYNLLIGGVSPIPPQVLALSELYLELVIDGETMAPRQKITSVPHAANASRIDGARLETGTATLDVSAASSAVVHVDFAQNFISLPRVVVTDLAGTIAGEAFESTRIYNITATGFDVEWKALSGSTVTGSAGFGYYAFGE